MSRLLFVVAVLLVSGCRGCAGPEAPDEYAVSRMVDPYARVTRVGSQLEQATAVLDEVGAQLGYGTVPGKMLAEHANEAWAQRLAAFLAHGGTEQLSAAWTDVRLGVTEGFGVPPKIKVRARQAEARVYDLQHAEADEETMRHAYLAEIAWMLVLRAQSPDAQAESQ